MIQYLAFRLLALIAPLPSPGFAYWLCERLGDITYRLLRRRRETVRRNLSVVLGARLDLLDPLSRETFREGTKYYYDTFRIPAMSDAEVERAIDLVGWQHVESALEAGNGAVLFTAHLGSPALVAQIVAVRGKPMTTVAEPVKPERLFRLINGVRGSRGLRLLQLGPTSFRDLSEVVRQNGIAGIVGDRDVQGSGIPVRLFGEETAMPTGPVMLALRTGAPLLPAFTYRKSGGRFDAVIGEPMALERTGDLREDIRVNTQRLAGILEDAVARSPEQWIVFEPIWPERTVPSSEIAR